MSVTSAKLYLERLATDDDFWSEFKSTIDKNDRKDLINNHGFTFNDNDLDEALDHFYQKIISMRSRLMNRRN